MAVLQTDGGASGNPGPAGLGVVLLSNGGEVIAEEWAPFGVATNNAAEYAALIRGLRLALERNVAVLDIRMDSELIVRQVQGRYRVKHPGLKPPYEAVMDLLARFERYSIRHVPRSENARADALARQGVAAAKKVAKG